MSNLKIKLIEDNEKAFNLTLDNEIEQINNFPTSSCFGKFRKKVGGAEDHIWNSLQKEVGDDALSVLWNTCFYSVFEHTSYGVLSWMAASLYTWHTLYLSGQDIPDITKKYPKNPYEGLVNILKLGLLPAGINKENNKELIIWHPSLISSKK